MGTKVAKRKRGTTNDNAQARTVWLLSRLHGSCRLKARMWAFRGDSRKSEAHEKTDGVHDGCSRIRSPGIVIQESA